MGVMTAQQVLPMTMVPGVVRVGAAADLLEDSGGGDGFVLVADDGPGRSGKAKVSEQLDVVGGLRRR